jgi:hypothetical protein
LICPEEPPLSHNEDVAYVGPDGVVLDDEEIFGGLDLAAALEISPDPVSSSKSPSISLKVSSLNLICPEEPPFVTRSGKKSIWSHNEDVAYVGPDGVVLDDEEIFGGLDLAAAPPHQIPYHPLNHPVSLSKSPLST